MQKIHRQKREPGENPGRSRRCMGVRNRRNSKPVWNFHAKEPEVERSPSQKNCKNFRSRYGGTRGTMRKTLCSKVGMTGLCLLFALGVNAIAADVQDLGVSEIALPPPTPADIAPSYEEILPSAWEGRGLSVAEVLSALPGIQSYRQGGMGSFQTVSIRGIAAKGVLICIDGIPMNDASGGAADLGTIDLNNIERIEIYKDRVPARFGGAGLGGAINFVTKRATPKTSGRFLASYGSHNTLEGSAQVTVSPKDSLNFAASVSARHSDNDYEFTNRNGTAYNPDDDFTDKRRNADFTEYSGNFAYRILHPENFFSTFTANLVYTKSGNPGQESSQTKVANFTGQSTQLGYRLEFPTLLNSVLLEAGLSGKFEKNVSASYYPLDFVGYSYPDYIQYGLAGYRLYPEIIGTVVLDRFEGTVRAAGSAEKWEARGSIREFGLSRYSASASASAELAMARWLAILAEGNLLKTFDDIDGGKFLMPTGTATIEDAEKRDLNLSGMVQLKLGQKKSFVGGNASFGRYYRQPQLMELYGVYRGVLSNPKLKNETATRFEIGGFVQTPSRKTTLRATYFSSFVENGIYWIASNNAIKAFNASKARIHGIELEAKSSPVPFFETTLRGTIQDPRDKGFVKMYNGKLLPGEPVHSYFVEGKFFLPFHLDLTFDASYRTRIFSDRINQTRQPATARYNASLGYSPWESTRLVFGVTNISDETYTNFYTPNPVPGREYRMTLIQKF